MLQLNRREMHIQDLESDPDIRSRWELLENIILRLITDIRYRNQ